jgi:hypothetical protein
MIVLVTGYFRKYDNSGRPTGNREFGVSHGIDMDTMENVVLPQLHPRQLGARFDYELGEWIIDD